MQSGYYLASGKYYPELEIDDGAHIVAERKSWKPVRCPLKLKGHCASDWDTMTIKILVIFTALAIVVVALASLSGLKGHSARRIAMMRAVLFRSQ